MYHYLFCTLDSTGTLTRWGTAEGPAVRELAKYFNNKKNFLAGDEMIIIEVESKKYLTLKQFASIYNI